MEAIASLPAADIPVVMMPTYEAFTPLLEANREKIQSIRRESFKYGSTDRHMLDAYYPPQAGAVKPPVLVFAYGGGFATGERTGPPPTNFDLVYACVGAFFASRGFFTVIPDYRLVPNVKHPQPDEDINEALAYVVKSFADVADTSSIFVHGHSAGASIVTSLFLTAPSLLDGDVKKQVKGLILMGTPYHYNGPPLLPPELLAAYYGGQHETDCPFGVLKSASKETASSLPSLFIIRSENEPEGIKLAHSDFVKLLKEKSDASVQEGIAEGHNHISAHIALSSGEGEEWGEEVVAWMKAHL